VVNNATIEEMGTHDELLALGGRYAALVEAWEASQPT
jgi:ABC-type multidrug transport system fused ATPase/permease subunit